MESLISRKKIGISVLILAFFLCLSVNTTFAFDSSRSNNKFGIHLATPDNTDMEKAAELVNSSGGKWGYVTLVIQENDRDLRKWQDVFNKLRELRLIPIIRIATEPQGDRWRRPEKEDTDSWVDFLNSLNWVVKDRYVVLFNEPNHGREWGGEVNPEHYADVAYSFAKGLKEKNKDFFIMLAGLDSAAPSAAPLFEDEGSFIGRVFQKEQRLLTENLIDGLASHSYPNPGFVGSPYAVGRNSIRNYEWELSLFSYLGIFDLPVFITETGWPHNEGPSSNQNFYSPDVLGVYTRSAFENVWMGDSRVRAVTPFILNYQGEPFASFSWKKLGEDEFYSHYFAIQQVPKVSGDPERIEKGAAAYRFPKKLLTDSSYRLTVKLQNRGQAIWDDEDGYFLQLEGDEPHSYFFSVIKDIKPDQESEADFFFKTGKELKNHKLRISLMQNDRKIIEGAEQSFQLVPQPSLTFSVNLFPKRRDEGNKFEIQIFDEKEQLVYKKKGLTVTKGIGQIQKIQNVSLGERHRVVVLSPYYLPRQKHISFIEGKNQVQFERMIPLDFDRDGNFDGWDIITLINNPKLFTLFFP